MTDTKSIAETALEQADSKELYRLFTEAQDTIKTLVSGMAIVSDTNKNPRQFPSIASESAISAMQAVSLAAIDLAKIAISKEKP